jgi:hypothetical protein
VTRRLLGWTFGGLLAAFLIVLAVPERNRALALYAFLLLVGALALGGLIVVLSATPPADDRRLVGATAAPDARPDELDTLDSGVRATLAGRTIDDTLHGRIRAIVAARLDRGHGVSLDRDPAGARAVLGEGLLWALVDPERSRRRTRLDAGELVAVVEALEAL